MKMQIRLFILLTVLALGACGKSGGNETEPSLESVVQSWTGSEYTIKTPIEEGDIRLTVSDNVSGKAKLSIPTSITAANNPNITIELSESAAFTGSLSIASNDYEGTIVLKQKANDKIAVGTASLSTDHILQVNLPKGSFTVASGKINGKATIVTRPGTFILGGVIAGDLIVEKGSVKIMVGGEVVSITIKDDEPLVINGTVSGTITVADGAKSPVTIGAGATVGAIIAPESSVVVESSTTVNTTIGTISGKDVAVGSGTTTKDITISSGGTIKIEQGGRVDGNVDASDASSTDIPDGTVSGGVSRPVSPDADGIIDDWTDGAGTVNPK